MVDEPMAVVVGGAGFIGTHLCDLLIQEGHRVLSIDLRNESVAERAAWTQTSELFSSLTLDIRKWRKGSVANLVPPNSVLFHLAANADIRRGMQQPTIERSHTLDTTFAVIDLATCTQADIVFTSSSAVFGINNALLTPDTGPIRPISEYGAAKAASEAFLSAFATRSNGRTLICRLPNVVGARATHGVIFDLVHAVARGQNQIMVLGDGSQRKPYVHVASIVRHLYQSWRHCPDAPLSVNHCPARGTSSVRDIVQTIAVHCSVDLSRFVFGSEPQGWQGDVPRYRWQAGTGGVPESTLHVPSSAESVRMAVRELWEEHRTASILGRREDG